MGIHEKLIKIQKALKAPKNQLNKFGGYKYRSCEDILEAVKPLLTDATLVLSDKLVVIGDRYYVEATASFEDKEETIVTHAYAREAVDKKGMDESQITGAASSYARKYALNGLFLIDDTKDADATNNHNGDEPAPVVNKVEKLKDKISSDPDRAQKADAYKAALADGLTKADIEAALQPQTLTSCTVAQMRNAIEYVLSKKVA